MNCYADTVKVTTPQGQKPDFSQQEDQRAEGLCLEECVPIDSNELVTDAFHQKQHQNSADGLLDICPSGTAAPATLVGNLSTIINNSAESPTKTSSCEESQLQNTGEEKVASKFGGGHGIVFMKTDRQPAPCQADYTMDHCSKVCLPMRNSGSPAQSESKHCVSVDPEYNWSVKETRTPEYHLKTLSDSEIEGDDSPEKILFRTLDLDDALHLRTSWNSAGNNRRIDKTVSEGEKLISRTAPDELHGLSHSKFRSRSDISLHTGAALGCCGTQTRSIEGEVNMGACQSNLKNSSKTQAKSFGSGPGTENAPFSSSTFGHAGCQEGENDERGEFAECVVDADEKDDDSCENEDYGFGGRVEIMSLPVMPNPLQKSGRHTVIKGRLSPDDPFSVATENLGYKLICKENEGRNGSRHEEDRRKFFLQDLNAFLREINCKHHKIPVIGGGELDVYSLIKEVMLLGGVHNVVRKRAFRIVAQQLRIPKTCTSAASVLKGAYEKLLFHYEQKLALGKSPSDPEKEVNMKEIVYREREREKLARGRSGGKVKRKHGRYLRSRAQEKRMRFTNSEAVVYRVTSAEMEAPAMRCRAQLARLAFEDVGLDWEIPSWATKGQTKLNLKLLLEGGRLMDTSKVQTGRDAIILATIECFDTLPDNVVDATRNSQLDLCLAADVLRLPPDSRARRKVRGFLLNLLVLAPGQPAGVVLADNRSARGLVDGLLHILRVYHQQHLQTKTCFFWWEKNGLLPFRTSLERGACQDIAAAYCSLRVLSDLLAEKQNHSKIFRDDDGIQIIGMYLAHPYLHGSFVMASLGALANAAPLLSGANKSGIVETLIQGLLSVLQRSVAALHDQHCSSMSQPLARMEVDIVEMVLKVLASYSTAWNLRTSSLQLLLDAVADLLLSENVNRHVCVDAVSAVTSKLVFAHSSIICGHKQFTSGIIRLLRSEKVVDSTVQCLLILHHAASLEEYRGEIRELRDVLQLTFAQRQSLDLILSEEQTSVEELNASPPRKEFEAMTGSPICETSSEDVMDIPLECEDPQTASILDSIFDEI